MKDFLNWAKERKLDIPALSEQRNRTGVRGVYPSAYFRSQYPDLYMTPALASAPVDLQNAEKQKDHAG